MTNETGGWATEYGKTQIRRPKVLVVDDLQANLFAMRKALARLDCEVIAASSGQEALSLCLRHQFAVILLDVQMPVMNGFETAELLRENPDTAQVPIIFVTAISKEERHIHAGYGTGAVDYIFKPVDSDILRAKVRVFLELDQQQRELKRMISEVSEISHKYQLLVDTVPSGVLGIDRDGLITFVNPAAEKLLGRPEELLEQPLMTLFGEKDNNAGIAWPQSIFWESIANQEPIRAEEGWLTGRDGKSFEAEYAFTPFAARFGMSGGVFILQDITRRKQVEAKLYRLARYDELTGLPNRTLFRDTLERTISKLQRTDGHVGLLFIDLDGFKAVNDTLGHAAGDYVLQEFSARLRRALRRGDLCGRLSGDEFAVIVDDAEDKKALEVLADKVIEAAREPMRIGDEEAAVSASVGIAWRQAAQTSVDRLLSEADSAMYRAKNAGKGRWSE